MTSAVVRLVRALGGDAPGAAERHSCETRRLAIGVGDALNDFTIQREEEVVPPHHPLSSVGLAIASFTATLAAAQSQSFLTIPPRERILETLRAERPRLLVDPDAFTDLRARLERDPRIAEWSRTIVDRADRMLDQSPSEYVIPDGKRLLATSRRVLDRVMTLAYAHHVRGGHGYLDRAWAELEAAAGFPDWNPSHFLDTAEMTGAFGLGYDWLYDSWTDDQRATLRDAIIRHGLEPALKCYRGEANYGWWVRSAHNWNQVCNGGVTIGALAITEEAPEVAAEIVRAAADSLPRAMRSFASDGGWGEGPGYWNYATRYNVRHLAALESALGTDFGLSRFPGFDETGDFPIHITGPTGRTFNFADGGDRRIQAAQMFWFARRFDEPAYAAYEFEHAAPEVLDVLWAAPIETPVDAHDPLPLDHHFEGIGVVTMRSAWKDPDATFIGFKGGSNAVNHSNLDLGSFVLDALGERWVVDLGADNYNLPGYFGGRRWTYYRLRAEGHNTLLINPGEGPDQDPNANAPVTRFESTDEEVRASIDLTAAYQPHVEHVRRSVALVEERSAVLVVDEIEPASQTETPLDIWWLLHTPATIEINEAEPSLAVLMLNGKRLEATILEPSGLSFETRPAEPLPSSPNPNGQRENNGVRKLMIHTSVAESLRLVVRFQPADRTDDNENDPDAHGTGGF